MWFIDFVGYSYRILLLFLAICQNRYYAVCDTVMAAKFNASLRDYSRTAENFNSTEVKTLQKQEPRFQKEDFRKVPNPIRFKNTPDSSLSSSSYSRGYAPQDLSDYGLNGFDVAPFEGGGGYDHYHHNEHEPHFYIDHGYRHHHKPHDHHALAIKTFLWPLAGIALLGAAAALVTNPVLIQLGVVSGRRRRSTFETTTAPNIELLLKNHFATTENTTPTKFSNKYEVYPLATRRNFQPERTANKVKENKLTRTKFSKVLATAPAYLESNTLDIPETMSKGKWDDKHLIPIPLKFKPYNVKPIVHF